MVIRGILDRSLSNRSCIRGFARIKELARISKANDAYQRKLVNEQEKVVSNFLTDENEFLFFPEVILSLKLKYDNTAKNANFSATPIQKLEQKRRFSSNVDSLKIRASRKTYKNSLDVNGKDEIVNVEIVFNDIELDELIKQDKHPLHRIDGNHRLSAAEQLSGDRIERMNIPYCIVLLEEISMFKFNPKTQLQEKVTPKLYEKFEKVVFNNINFKSLPLTLEQNLNVILSDTTNFPDEDVEKKFGKSWLYTRKLCDRIKIDDFGGIKHLLKENVMTYSKNIFEILLAKHYSECTIVDDVFKSFQTIEQLYLREKDLCKNTSGGLFVAFLFYNITDEKRYNSFKGWVLQHDIFDIEEAKTETIIQFFDKIIGQVIKVFVAMPFFTRKDVDMYNEIYKTVIDEIKNDYHINIKCYDIMTYSGNTIDIVQDILNKITECDIFIADITKNNSNVTYEMGWARALKKIMIVIKEESAKQPKLDYSMLHYVIYKKTDYTTLKNVIRENIKAILIKEEQFGLGGVVI
jgi:nucleoside 2-deoxyribosyltransferase